MGPQPAPELPEWEPFTWPNGFREIVLADVPCNWFQCPGELDRPGAFRMDARQLEQAGCAAATRPRRSISSSISRSSSTASSTSACARARARRTATGQSAASRCGRTASTSAATSNGACRSTTRTRCRWRGSSCACRRAASPMCRTACRRGRARSSDEDGRWITSHVINQDIVAWVGQGTIADRTQEHLRSSDIGITMMRQRFFEDIEAIKEGREPKGVVRDPKLAQSIDLPDMARELNTDGNHARGIPEGSAAAPAAQGVPPPLRPAVRGAGGVCRGDGDLTAAASPVTSPRRGRRGERECAADVATLRVTSPPRPSGSA